MGFEDSYYSQGWSVFLDTLAFSLFNQPYSTPSEKGVITIRPSKSYMGTGEFLDTLTAEAQRVREGRHSDNPLVYYAVQRSNGILDKTEERYDPGKIDGLIFSIASFAEGFRDCARELGRRWEENYANAIFRGLEDYLAQNHLLVAGLNVPEVGIHAA